MRIGAWCAATGMVALLALPTVACGSGGTGTPPAGGEVTVSMTEFSLTLSSSDLPAGTYTFVAKNDGKIAHALEIGGNGLEEKETAQLSPGKSDTLTVTLKDGTYQLYCPVDGHRGMGMSLDLTVGGAGSSGGDGSSGGSGGY